MNTQQLQPEEWIERFSDMLFRFALLRLGNRELARDLVQDTFLSALKSNFTVTGEEIKPLLYSILKNKIIDYYKKKKSYTFSDIIREDDSDDFFDSSGHWKPGAITQDWETDASSETLRSEIRSILHTCLTKLNEAMRNVFVMKFVEECETDEICSSLEITMSNYWVLVHRAKLQLRGCVEKKYGSKGRA